MAEKKIMLTLKTTEYPLVLRTYGLEGAKEQAIRMLLAEKSEITERALYSVLTNLEQDLQMQTAMLTEDEDE